MRVLLSFLNEWLGIRRRHRACRIPASAGTPLRPSGNVQDGGNTVLPLGGQALASTRPPV
jgi:hypothetical protein